MACVSAVTASSYLPSVKARTPVSKYVWASWAASGIARKSSTPQSNHSGIDRRIASSLPARNSATDMASCPCKATDPTTVCQFPRIFLLYMRLYPEYSPTASDSAEDRNYQPELIVAQVSATRKLLEAGPRGSLAYD